VNLERDLSLHVMSQPPGIIGHKLQDHLTKRLQEHFLPEEPINGLLGPEQHRQNQLQIRDRQLANNLKAITVLNGFQYPPHIKHILQEPSGIDGGVLLLVVGEVLLDVDRDQVVDLVQVLVVVGVYPDCGDHAEQLHTAFEELWVLEDRAGEVAD